MSASLSRWTNPPSSSPYISRFTRQNVHASHTRKHIHACINAYTFSHAAMHQPARMDADAEKAKHRLQLARGAVGCERKAPQAGTIPTALQAYDNAAAGRNRVGQHSSHRVFAASVIEYLTEDDLVQYGNKPENGRCAVVYASCQHKRLHALRGCARSRICTGQCSSMKARRAALRQLTTEHTRIHMPVDERAWRSVAAYVCVRRRRQAAHVAPLDLKVGR